VKRTISVSSNLDKVLAFWANGREVYALENPDNGQCRFSKATTWQPGLHTLGDFRQLEPLKALFFPAREYIGRWNDQTAREPLPERIVFGVKNCDLSAL
jgi:hypothetical protein